MEKSLFGGGGCSRAWESSSNNGNNFKYEKDYPYGYPWPPRYYTCSFCQREFKSAQALGGHMNIHRRDRARLRDQSSPNNSPIWASNNNNNNNNSSSSDHLHPNPNSSNPNNPNPNNPTTIPSSTTSPASNNIYAHQYSLVSLSLSSLPPSTKSSDEFGRELQGVGKWKDFSSLENHHHHYNHLRRHQEHDGDHEVRVLKSSNSNCCASSTKGLVKLDLELCLGEAKEDLDLELRLGI